MNSPEQPRGSVAVTGGSGFVGRHVVRRLLAAGWHVRALLRRPDALDDLAAAGSVSVLHGDLAGEDTLGRLVAGADAVVHCAGLVAARSTREFMAVNSEGTARLLRAVGAAGTAPRFVLVSSLAAREPQLSPYARSKRQAEEQLRSLGAGLHWQILRPPVVYGPGDRATLPLFRQFARGLALCPAGSGRFSMIYVEDLAAAAADLLQTNLAPGQVLELDDGTAEGYGWPDVLATAERQLGRPIRVLAVPRPLQRVAAVLSTAGAALTGRAPMLSQGKVNEITYPDWVCRHDRLDDCFSWRPRVGLDEGFARTLAWYKAAGWL